MDLICSWSGRKESFFALIQMNQQAIILLNAPNEIEKISHSYNLYTSILHAQIKYQIIHISQTQLTEF
jgi:diphthine-ammonia ligase